MSNEYRKLDDLNIVDGETYRTILPPPKIPEARILSRCRGIVFNAPATVLLSKIFNFEMSDKSVSTEEIPCCFSSKPDNIATIRETMEGGSIFEEEGYQIFSSEDEVITIKPPIKYLWSWNDPNQIEHIGQASTSDFNSVETIKLRRSKSGGIRQCVVISNSIREIWFPNAKPDDRYFVWLKDDEVCISTTPITKPDYKPVPYELKDHSKNNEECVEILHNGWIIFDSNKLRVERQAKGEDATPYSSMRLLQSISDPSHMMLKIEKEPSPFNRDIFKTVPWHVGFKEVLNEFLEISGEKGVFPASYSEDGTTIKFTLPEFSLPKAETN